MWKSPAAFSTCLVHQRWRLYLSRHLAQASVDCCALCAPCLHRSASVGLHFPKGAVVSLRGWARVGAWPACFRSCSPSPLHTLVLSGVFTDVEASLKDIRDLLEEDELLDQKLQEAVGQAGASMAVSKAELAEVRREWAKYMEVHEKASFTNSELHRAMNLHVGNLRLLSGPLDQVRAALPTPALTAGEPCPSCAPVLKCRAGGPSGLTDHCCPQRTRPCCRT